MAKELREKKPMNDSMVIPPVIIRTRFHYVQEIEEKEKKGKD